MIAMPLSPRVRAVSRAKLGADALDPVLVRERRDDRRLLGGDDLFVQGARLPRRAGVARRAGIARHGDRD
jgi:hypothetical protein